MTVYLDVVLFENLCMNYIILFATSYFLRIQIKHWKLILASLIGGFYAIISYMEILPIYSTFSMKIILSVAIIYIAYSPRKFKILIKELVVFYLTTFAFGGCAFALLYLIKPQNIFMKNGVYIGSYPIKITILGGLIGFVITYIAFKIVKIKINRRDIIYTVKIKIQDKEVEVKALLDTGNQLREPITGNSVIVVSKQKLYSVISKKILDNLENILGGDGKYLLSEIEEKYLLKFRIIPFSSIGKQNGLMLGVKADRIIIEKEDSRTVKDNVIIGIFNQKLDKNDRYSALISLDLLDDERSKKDEFVANFKR